MSESLLKRKAPRPKRLSSIRKRVYDYEGDPVTGRRWYATVVVPTPACMPTPTGSIAQARQRVAEATAATKAMEQLKLVVLLRRVRGVRRHRLGRGMSEADKILSGILKQPKPPVLAYCLSNASRRLRTAERLIKWVRPSPLKKGIAIYKLRIAQLFAEAGKYRKASTWLKKSRSKTPSMRVYRQYIQAWLHIYQGRYAQAVRLLQRVLRTAPGKVRPYAVGAIRRELIHYFVKTLRPGDPVVSLKRVLGVSKMMDLPKDLQSLGRAASNQGEPAKASAAWNALLDFQSTRKSSSLLYVVLHGLVASYGAQGQSTQATRRIPGVVHALRRLLNPKKVPAHARIIKQLRSMLKSLGIIHQVAFVKTGDLREALTAATYYDLYLNTGGPGSRQQTLKMARYTSNLLLLLIKRHFALSHYKWTLIRYKLAPFKYPRVKHPGVFIGAPAVLRNLTARLIRSVVRGRLRAVQVCYEEGLNRNRKLAGTIQAKFTIPLSGKATRVTVVSATIKDAKLSRCIKNVVTQLRFPTSPNIGRISHVTFPFHLKPAKE